MQTHDFSTNDQTFLSRLEESQRELEILRVECMAQNISDPLALIHEKRMLINQLDLILSFDILIAWEQCKNQEITSEEIQRQNDQSKMALYKVMESFHNVVLSLKNLDIYEDEEKFQSSLAIFDNTLNIFNTESNDYNRQADRFNQQYASFKKNRKRIEHVVHGANLSTSMGGLTTAIQILIIIGFSFAITLKKAAMLVGTVCYPIGALFTSITKLFNLFATHTLLGQLRNEREIALNNLERLNRLKEAENLLKKERWLRITSIVLVILAGIAFATALTSPIGWALMAVSTIVDWREAGVNGVKKAELEFQHAQADLLKANNAEQVLEIQKIVDEKKQALNQAKTDERWYRVNVIAMGLFALAPIPVVGQVLLGVGVIIFGVATVRNVYVSYKSHSVKPAKKAEMKETSADSKKSEQATTLTNQNTKKLTTSSLLIAFKNNNTQQSPTYFDLDTGPSTTKNIFSPSPKNKKKEEEKEAIELVSKKSPDQNK